MNENKTAHPSLSINTLSLKPAALDVHVSSVARLGVRAISPTLEEIVDFGAAASRRLFSDAKLTVATLTHRAFAYGTPEAAAAGRKRLADTIGLAEAVEARTITLTTGGRGDLTWKDAAARFAAEIAPCAERARTAGIPLALEPTSHLYADASIAHRLADVVALARDARINVGIDLFACWADSDIEDAIALAGPHCALVQISDYVLGDRGLPCRAVPGDGSVPLDRLVRLILEGGYRGAFDIEVIGPRLAAEGVEAGLRRAIQQVSAILENGMAGLACRI